MSERALKQKQRRVWEIDFLRGFCMLFVIWDHLMFDIGGVFQHSVTTGFGKQLASFAAYYWTCPLRTATHDWFVAAFVIVSGLSTVFSRNELVKALKIAAAAIVVTAASYVVSNNGANVRITFGVLHMLAVCGLIWWVLKKCKAPWWIVAPLGVAALVAGYVIYAQRVLDPIGPFFLFWSQRASFSISPGDFWPLLPWLGWFLLGGVLGGFLYKEKRTRLPFVKEKYLLPITFVGKHALWFYLGSQVVGFGLIYALTALGWL